MVGDSKAFCSTKFDMIEIKMCLTVDSKMCHNLTHHYFFPLRYLKWYIYDQWITIFDLSILYHKYKRFYIYLIVTYFLFCLVI